MSCLTNLKFNNISHQNKASNTISMQEFLLMANKKGVRIPKNISPYRFGAIKIDNISDTTPIIANLVNSGELTVICEYHAIINNLISCRLLWALMQHKDVIEFHWKNLCQQKINFSVYIDNEKLSAYSRNFMSVNGESFARLTEDNFLYSTDFLDGNYEDGITTFKGALRYKDPKVVIFDMEPVWREGSKIKIFNEVVSCCRCNNIGIVVILRNEELLKFLPSPDRLVHIWKKPDSKGHYIVETDARLNEPEIAPFEFWFENKLCKSKNLKKDVLSEIHDRENRNTELGLATSFVEEENHDINSLFK